MSIDHVLWTIAWLTILGGIIWRTIQFTHWIRSRRQGRSAGAAQRSPDRVRGQVREHLNLRPRQSRVTSRTNRLVPLLNRRGSVLFGSTDRR